MIENDVLELACREIEGLPGGKIIDKHVSTLEEATNTAPNGFVLFKYYENNPIFTTVIFEYEVNDPYDYIQELFSGVKYIAE